MRIDEKWIRAHLPGDCADEPLDVFSGYYLDGLTGDFRVLSAS